MSEPLFANRDEWRRRWLCTDHGDVLHRIERIEMDEDECSGPGESVCGLTAHFSIPGIFSRMERTRCARCCDKLGIPRGNGAPFNADIEEPGCEGPDR